MKFLLLLTLLIVSCTAHNSEKKKINHSSVDSVTKEISDNEPNTEVDEKLYCTIVQRAEIDYYPTAGYTVITQVWVGKKYHDKETMNIEYDSYKQCAIADLEATKSREYQKALQVKKTIDPTLNR